MSLNPKTYEEALDGYKPLKRSRLKQKASKGLKASHKSGKRQKRPRKLTTGQLKKRVWTEFSIFIRTHNATQDLGLERCVTCGVVKRWTELQAGHFIRGRLNANLFEERGVHPQCYRCNISFQGNVVVYYGVMLQKYGQEVIDELLEQNNHTKKWAPLELEGLYRKYKELNAQNPLCQKP